MLPYFCPISDWQKVYLNTPVQIGLLWLRKIKEDRTIAINTALLPAMSFVGSKNILTLIKEISRLYGVYTKVLDRGLTKAHKKWLEYLTKKKNKNA